MTQSPDPNNPYGQQGTPFSPQSGQSSAPEGAGWAPQQDSSQADGQFPPQDAYQQQYQQAGYDQQQGSQQQGFQPGYQQPAGAWSDVPPADLKGVYTGPMTGQPTTDSDVMLWSMAAQLSVLLSWLTVGFLGWLGPLIVFLVYKDRNRYIRYNAAEALNAAISVVIIEIVLSIVFGIITALALSVGWILFLLIGIPALVHGVFAIIGAVKVNKNEWWNYPVNIRLVK